MKVTIQKWYKDQNQDLILELEESQDVSNIESSDGQVEVYGTEQLGTTILGDQAKILITVILDKEVVEQIRNAPPGQLQIWSK